MMKIDVSSARIVVQGRLRPRVGEGPRQLPVQAAAEKPAVAGHDVDFRLPREDGQLLGEVGRLPDVVAVENGDEVAAADGERHVARRRNSAVRLLQQPDARIAGGQAPHGLVGRVGRAVVDDQQLPVGNGLRLDGINRRADVGRDVVRRHDYADCCHGSSTLGPARRGRDRRGGRQFDGLVQLAHRSCGGAARPVEQIGGNAAALGALLARIRKRPLDRGECRRQVVDRTRHRGQQRHVVRVDVGQLDQLRPVDADQRAIPEQELEAGGTVVGDHHVGRDEIRRDVVAGCECALARREQRLQPGRPVDAARVALAQVARAIVQLHDHVDRHPAERRDELHADRVQRRGRRPGRRVEHRRPGRVEPERLQHVVALIGAIHQAVDLRHADEPDGRAVGVDGAAGDEVAQPALVHEEEAVPLAHRPIGGVEAVLAADPVEDLDARRIAQERRPHEVGGDVGVEPDDGGAARVNQPDAPGVAAGSLGGESLVVDLRHARRFFGRGEVELHARIGLHRAEDRRDHREVHRRPRVDENAAAIGPAGEPLVELTDAAQERADDLAHACAPTAVTVRAATARRCGTGRRRARQQVVAWRDGERQQVVERPVVGDRREQRAEEPAGKGSRDNGGIEAEHLVFRFGHRLDRGGAARRAAAGCSGTKQAARLKRARGTRGSPDRRRRPARRRRARRPPAAPRCGSRATLLRAPRGCSS